MADRQAAAPAKWGDLGVRFLSAVVLIPAVLVDVWAGGIWFEVFVALLAVLMAYEWTVLTHRQSSLQFALHAAAAMSGALLPREAGMDGALIAIMVLWALSAIAARIDNPQHPVWAYIGVPYVGLPAIAMVLLRNDPDHGTAAIIWVMVTVWAADTLAYFSGRIIGGPKLAPEISPKKTWAGLGGAIAGSAAASAVFAWYAGYPAMLVLTLIAGAFAVVEQAGDLFKSAWKRHYGVKDSGRLIPGHGGVIDRVDGLVAVAVAAALVGYLHSGIVATARGLLSW